MAPAAFSKFDAETTPLYFSLALTRSYNIYIVYFLLFIVCITCFGYPVDIATVEKAPKVEGRSMTMFLTEKR